MTLADASTVAFFGLMAFAAMCIALRAEQGRDREDALMLSWLLIAAWAMSNIAWLFFNPLHVNSVIDVATIGLCLFAFRPLDGWRWGFACSVVFQIAIDIYREIAITDFTFWAILLNASFGLQVVIVILGANPHVRNRLSHSARNGDRPRSPTKA